MIISNKGIISNEVFGEKLISRYDSNLYVEADGSVWIRVFCHNNPASNLFSYTDKFTNPLYKSENAWFDFSTCYFLEDNWEFILEQKDTSSSALKRYRLIQHTNPMEAVFADVDAADISWISSGYDSHNSTWGGLYKRNGNTYLCMNNTNSGNWWGAVGSWNALTAGTDIPGFNGARCSTGYMNVYLRIDNAKLVNQSVKIYQNGISANSFIEI